MISFEESHGKKPEPEELDRLIERYGIGILDQWNLCCCKCETCKPNCRCNK